MKLAKEIGQAMERLQTVAADLAAHKAAHEAEVEKVRQEEIRKRCKAILWALNDESATNGVYGIPALGEIGRRAPEMLAPYVPALVSMVVDSGLRIELLRALAAIAEPAPHLVAGHLDELASCIDDSRRDERQALQHLIAAAGREAGHDD